MQKHLTKLWEEQTDKIFSYDIKKLNRLRIYIITLLIIILNIDVLINVYNLSANIRVQM